jgi:DNA repair protein RadA/Sms
MEGTRPILAEVQALAAKSSFSAPRRTATGFDFSRMSIILAVLEKRGGIFCGGLDVYLNVVGGFRIDEPAGDLSVALALQSTIFDKPIPEKVVAFGEVGLGGEVRSVSHITQRVKEAERMGFSLCIVPKYNLASLKGNKFTIRIAGVSSLKQAFAVLANSEQG